MRDPKVVDSTTNSLPAVRTHKFDGGTPKEINRSFACRIESLLMNDVEDPDVDENVHDSVCRRPSMTTSWVS